MAFGRPNTFSAMAARLSASFHRHESPQLLEPILNDNDLAARPHALRRGIFHEQEAALPHVVLRVVACRGVSSLDDDAGAPQLEGGPDVIRIALMATEVRLAVQ